MQSAQMTGGARKCPRCGAELNDRVLGGQCPACMVQVVRQTSAAGDAPDSSPTSRKTQTPLDPVNLRYFGDYELLGEVGRGGMGIVYKARQLSLNRLVALKVVAPEQLASPKAVERFHTEAEAAANLDHPNIVPIYETSQIEGRHYFSMKLIEGQSLASRMADFRLPIANVKSQGGAASTSRSQIANRQLQIANLLAQVADAVHYAHQRGILHRDLKPGNILLNAAGGAHVSDFGLAKLVEGDSSLTLSGEVLGTPAYMAPEQAAGRVSQITVAADVYSLGVILYELLTGRPPFARATPIETLHAALHEEPPSPRLLNSAVARDLETICLKCLEREPGRRYTNAQEFGDELRRFARGEPIQARATTPTEKVWRWCRRKPALAASLLVLHVVMALGLAGILWEWRSAKTNATAARANELSARESLYAADIGLAQQALASDNLRQALDLLEKSVPKPGEPDLRGFEWRYLWRQCQSDELFSLPGHGDTVESVAFSPDGKRLATGSMDTTVKIWDLASRRGMATLTNHTEPVDSVAFSPSGNVLATASDNAVWLWDTKTFRPLRSLPDAILKAKFSPDGKFLITGMTNGLIFWDTETWTALRKLELAGLLRSHPDWPNNDSAEFGLAFTSDSHRVGVASNEGIRILRIPDLQETAMLPDSLPRLRPIAFSPDGRTIAAAALGHVVKVWDVETRHQTNLLSGHSDSVFGLAFSPNGTKLATASGDQTVKLWDTAKGELIRTFRGHAEEVWDVVFSPDGKLLTSVSKGGAVKVSDALGSSSEAGDLAGILPLGFDSTGNVVVVNVTNRMFTAFDPESSQPVSAWPVGKAGAIAAFRSIFRDGRTAVIIRGNPSDPLEHPRIELWDLSRGKLLFSQREATLRLGFSPKAGILATGGSDGSVSLWRIPGGTRQCVLTNAGFVLGFSADGAMLATFKEGEIDLWRVKGQRTDRYATLTVAGEFQGTELSPDGRLLATAGADSVIRLWALPSGRPIATLTGHKRASIVVSFSPDGRTLASCSDDGTVRLWHVATGRELLKFHLPMGDVTSRSSRLRFSQDGRALGAYWDDEHGQITRLWFAPSFAEIAVAEGRDYRAQMGGDPAIWLATGRALARRNRDTDALEVFTKVIQFCGNQPDLEPLRNQRPQTARATTRTT